MYWGYVRSKSVPWHKVDYGRGRKKVKVHKDLLPVCLKGLYIPQNNNANEPIKFECIG